MRAFFVHARAFLRRRAKPPPPRRCDVVAKDATATTTEKAFARNSIPRRENPRFFRCWCEAEETDSKSFEEEESRNIIVIVITVTEGICDGIY